MHPDDGVSFSDDFSLFDEVAASGAGTSPLVATNGKSSSLKEQDKILGGGTKTRWSGNEAKDVKRKEKASERSCSALKHTDNETNENPRESSVSNSIRRALRQHSATNCQSSQKMLLSSNNSENQHEPISVPGAFAESGNRRLSLQSSSSSVSQLSIGEGMDQGQRPANSSYDHLVTAYLVSNPPPQDVVNASYGGPSDSPSNFVEDLDPEQARTHAQAILAEAELFVDDEVDSYSKRGSAFHSDCDRRESRQRLKSLLLLLLGSLVAMTILLCVVTVVVTSNKVSDDYNNNKNSVSSSLVELEGLDEHESAFDVQMLTGKDRVSLHAILWGAHALGCEEEELEWSALSLSCGGKDALVVVTGVDGDVDCFREEANLVHCAFEHGHNALHHVHVTAACGGSLASDEVMALRAVVPSSRSHGCREKVHSERKAGHNRIETIRGDLVQYLSMGTFCPSSMETFRLQRYYNGCEQGTLEGKGLCYEHAGCQATHTCNKEDCEGKDECTIASKGLEVQGYLKGERERSYCYLTNHSGLSTLLSDAETLWSAIESTFPQYEAIEARFQHIHHIHG